MKNWISIPYIIVLILLFTTSVIAQQTKSEFWQKVRFGGNLGLNFGDGYFAGTLAPSAIYEFNE